MITKNNVFASLINDEHCEEEIELYSIVTPEAFELLLVYYGRGVVNVDDNTVCDLMLLCFCYNEMELFKKCKKYVVDHMNLTIAKHFLDILPNINDKKFKEIIDIVREFLLGNGWEFLESGEIYDMNIPALKLILSIPYLVVNDEKEVLSNLLLYYTENQKNDTDKKFQKLLPFIRWEEIPSSMINVVKKKRVISDSQLLTYFNQESGVKRTYFSIFLLYSLEATSNAVLNNYIINFILKDEFLNDVDSIINIIFRKCRTFIKTK